jgi:hypothetical protein
VMYVGVAHHCFNPPSLIRLVIETVNKGYGDVDVKDPHLKSAGSDG